MTFIFIAREQRLTDKCAKQSCAEQLNARVRATTQFQSRLCGQIGIIVILIARLVDGIAIKYSSNVSNPRQMIAQIVKCNFD